MGVLGCYFNPAERDGTWLGGGIRVPGRGSTGPVRGTPESLGTERKQEAAPTEETGSKVEAGQVRL
jgi:hypothetical protein